jgi:hypothetical protein
MRASIATAALAASLGLSLFGAGTAQAEQQACRAERRGDGWEVAFTGYSRPDGTVVEMLSQFTFRAEVAAPGADAGIQINTLNDKARLPAAGFIVIESWETPGGSALGKFTLSAPGYFNPSAALMSGFSGEPAKPLTHILRWKTGEPGLPQEVLYEAAATLSAAPAGLDASQAEMAAASLGYADAKAPTPGGPAEARRALDITNRFTAKGGAVEVLIEEAVGGKTVRTVVGRFQVSRDTLVATGQGYDEAVAEARAMSGSGRCKPA